MDFDSKNLCQILDQYKKVVIYGTGNYARLIYPNLIEGNLKEKIMCFTQTEEKKDDSIDGVPVFNINELKCDKASCVVLVAVSELYVNEIKQILIAYHYPNIVVLPDFMVDNERSKKQFYGLNTFEEYCDHIASWYVKTHAGVADKVDIVKKLLSRGMRVKEKKDPKLIVMICGNVSTRSNTIVSALKKAGYNIIMLYYYVNGITWTLNELYGLKIQICRCQSIEEMLYSALEYYPLLYYFEPRWADCSWAEIMFKNKAYFGKVVISLYDVINDGYFGQSQKRLDSERYVLENADGIIWRWFSKECLEKKGFVFQGKSIQFLDYCSDVDMNSTSERIEPDVLKLCMVIGVDTILAEVRTHRTRYKSAAKIGEILEKIGDREDCIFHFYAGRLSKERIDLCKQYEKRYKNFRLFLNTEREELLKRLRQYDYGCNLYTEGEVPPDDFLIDCSTGSGMKDYVRNTFAEYLNAELPIIATMPQKYIEYMKCYEVIIEMDISDMNIEYLKKNKHYYKDKVKKARGEINIDNEIPRLIEFLKEI